nr:hypothetical protein [Gordonia sp. LAM0048]
MLLGVGLWMVALRAQHAAERDANRAQAIALAARSETEPDTRRAVELASEAVRLNDDAVSANALALARDRDNRLRRSSVRPDDYWSLVMAPAGTHAAATSMEAIHVFDRVSGAAVRTIPVEIKRDAGAIGFTSAEALVYLDPDGNLTKTSLADTQTVVVSDDVRAFAIGPQRLWWSSISSNTLTSARHDGSDRRVTEIPVSLDSLSFDAPSDRLDAVDTNGNLVSATVDGGTATLRTSRPVGGGDISVSEKRRGFSTVKRCGDRVFGAIDNYRMSLLSTTFIASEKSIRTDRGASHVQVPVCLDDSDAWGADIYGSSFTFGDSPSPLIPPAARLVIAGDSSGRLYSLTQEGTLHSMAADAAATAVPAPGVLVAVPVGQDKTLEFTADGRVVDHATKTAMGSGYGLFYPNATAMNGESVAILAEAGVVVADGDGRVAVAEIRDLTGLASINAVTTSADGEHFLVVTGNRVDEVDTTGRVIRTHEFSWLDENETLVSASKRDAGNLLAVATDKGRVATIDSNVHSGQPEFVTEGLTPGYGTTVAFTRDNDLIVVTPEGQVRLLDPSMKVRRSVIVGSNVDAVRIHGDRIAVSSEVVGTIVYQASDLTTIAQIDPSTAASHSLFLTPSGDAVVGMRSFGGVAEESALLVTIPLTTRSR